MKIQLIRALLAVTALCFSCVAAAQQYPSKLVRMVVPYPAGGGADALARLIALNLAKSWDQTVIVENRAGANGNIGAEFVVKSAPDGYVMLFSPSPVYTTAKTMYPNLPFDPEQDLKPVSLVAVAPNVLLVTQKLPVSSFKELVAYAKANPGELTYASQGIGSTAHLTGAYLAQVAGIEIRHVPYRGAAPALADLTAGHVAMAWDGVSSSLGLVSGGRVRALAVASAKPLAVLPNVPTVSESGFPNFESASWYGVTVPKGTSDAVVNKLSQSIAAVLRQPEVRDKVTSSGANVIGSTPEELATYMKADSARWKKVIESAQIRLDPK